MRRGKGKGKGRKKVEKTLERGERGNGEWGKDKEGIKWRGGNE